MPVHIVEAPSTHVATAFGNFHATQGPLRHHHVCGDVSVVLADGNALQSNGDGEDLSISPTLALFVALIPSAMAPLPAAPDATTASHAPWAPQTHHPALPEHPPRVAWARPLLRPPHARAPGCPRPGANPTPKFSKLRMTFHTDHASARFARSLLSTAVLLACTQGAAAQEAAEPTAPPATVVAQAAPQTLPAVQIQGNYINSVGSSDAASAGTVTSKLIESRPTLRPAEVLEFVPGVIVSQHSGDGKANQYYLRGFNLDHGTDFATWVDGMPVNMPTHAHGHGYSDLNSLIPELVDRIRYKKGPFYAEESDFSSAGSARISLFDAMPRGIASVTLGQERFARGLFANSDSVGPGKLPYALELGHNNGLGTTPRSFTVSTACCATASATRRTARRLRRWATRPVGIRPTRFRNGRRCEELRQRATTRRVVGSCATTALKRRQGHAAGHEQARRRVPAHLAHPRGTLGALPSDAEERSRQLAGKASHTPQREHRRRGGCTGAIFIFEPP